MKNTLIDFLFLIVCTIRDAFGFLLIVAIILAVGLLCADFVSNAIGALS